MKNTTAIGQRAEAAVATWLAKRHHQIIARNWRTKTCEIDLISLAPNQSGTTEIYFTEVKMRQSPDFGDGLAAITPAKLHQMHRAAEFFLQQRPQFARLQPLLAAAYVNGSFTVQDYVIIY
ncbi:YraN family protein [Candidatus Saccharibacteria bacterium]|nr:YraN family protein [Candidatus Saccharibacteria bacterium]